MSVKSLNVFVMRRYLCLIILILLIANPQDLLLGQDRSHETDILSVSSSGEYLHEVGIDTTSIEAVKAALKGPDNYISSEAALFLAQKKGKSTLSLILNRYKKVDKFNVGSYSYLQALKILDYEKLTSLTREFADSIYHKINLRKEFLGGEPLYISTVDLLFQEKDYSHFKNVQALLKQEADSTNANTSFLYLFEEVSNVRSLENEIINTIIYLLEHSKDKELRLAAVNLSDEFPNSHKLKQALKKAAREDPRYEVRLRALHKLRFNFWESNIIQLALKNIHKLESMEKAEEFLTLIANTNTPESLYEVKKLSEQGGNTKLQDLASKYYKQYWDVYFLPYAENFVSVNEKKSFTINRAIDSLKAHTREIASYDWLGNRGFVKELNNRLDNASRHLARGDSINVAKQIANYQERLQEVYSSNKGKKKGRYITEDGYKFLFKNAAYLLTKLPPHPSDNKNKGR